MVFQDSPEPGYPATAGYVLRRRERCWLGSIIVHLRHEKLRLGKLAAAVHAYAPGLPAWDAGKIK